MIMQYKKANFGLIKLTVGILRGNREKLQYCITAIEKKRLYNPQQTRNSYTIVYFFRSKNTTNFSISNEFSEKNFFSRFDKFKRIEFD